MRVAAIYDIHGNLPALEAVLHDIRAAAVELTVVVATCFQAWQIPLAQASRA